MKPFKILLFIIAIALLLLVVAGYFVIRNVDSIAKNAIEDIGSDMLQTDVAVNSVDLSLTQGRGEIGGLTVGNLEGYEQPNLFTLDHIALQVDPTTLRDSVITINEIIVGGAKLTVEHQGVAQTNIKQMLDTLKARAGSDEPSSKSTREQRFQVQSLKFTDVSMDVVSPQIANRTLALPSIERSNLGSAEQGLTPKELGIAIIQPLLEQARAKVEDEVRGRAGEKVRDVLDKSLSEEDKAKLDQLKSLIR